MQRWKNKSLEEALNICENPDTILWPHGWLMALLFGQGLLMQSKEKLISFT